MSTMLKSSPTPWRSLNDLTGAIVDRNGRVVCYMQPPMLGNEDVALGNKAIVENANEVLQALEAVSKGMMEMQGFIPNFMDVAIKKSRGLIES